MGRSFHLVASCSRELVIVWKVVVRDLFNPEAAVFKEPLIEPIFVANAQHQGEVWRLSWNLLGTCLASSGEDGTVRIWKKAIKGFS